MEAQAEEVQLSLRERFAFKHRGVDFGSFVARVGEIGRSALEAIAGLAPAEQKELLCMVVSGAESRKDFEGALRAISTKIHADVLAAQWPEALHPPLKEMYGALHELDDLLPDRKEYHGQEARDLLEKLVQAVEDFTRAQAALEHEKAEQLAGAQIGQVEVLREILDELKQTRAGLARLAKMEEDLAALRELLEKRKS